MAALLPRPIVRQLLTAEQISYIDQSFSMS